MKLHSNLYLSTRTIVYIWMVCDAVLVRFRFWNDMIQINYWTHSDSLKFVTKKWEENISDKKTCHTCQMCQMHQTFHMWGVFLMQPQQSQGPPHHHLSTAAPMLPALATTMKTTTMSWEGWKSVRRVGRRGKRGQEDDNDAACNPHAVLSISFYL